MPELAVVIVATDNEQRAVLQVLVDGTSVARTVHTCASFPVAGSDPVTRRVRAANPDVTLVDIPADNATPALRAIELLHQEMPEGAIFAIGNLNQPQVIVNAMRAGAREFIERPTTTTDLLEAFVRLTTAQRRDHLIGKYRELIGIAQEVVEGARLALEKTRKARGKDIITDIAIGELRKEIEHYCGLADRVIGQARRRVLEGEQVPNAEKVYSIFEPHTDLIKRGKVRTPVEFGHKIFLAESAVGLITQYHVLKGNPSDESHVGPSFERHKESFGRAPELYGSDRGFFSEENVTLCEQSGVKTACLPQRGGAKTPEREAFEKSRDFKKGQRFRAGIEGRISVLFRGRGMKRCRAEGLERFELFVGAAVLTNNLMKIADLLIKRSARKRRAA